VPGRRHSTKKKTSTTSRTTKRTAMAHHWRRSGRQDTSISAHDATLPQVQSHARPGAGRGQDVYTPGTQRLWSLPGARVPWPAPRVHPQLCQSPDNGPLVSTCFVSQAFNYNLRRSACCWWAPCPWEGVGIGVTDQSPFAFISYRSQIISFNNTQ